MRLTFVATVFVSIFLIKFYFLLLLFFLFLLGQGNDLTVYEKSKTFGGRCATRTSRESPGVKYDTGAQYYSLKAVMEGIHKRWESAGVVAPWFKDAKGFNFILSFFHSFIFSFFHSIILTFISICIFIFVRICIIIFTFI